MNKKALLDYSVYLVVRVVICLLQSLSMRQCRVLAAWMAWIAFRADKRHTQVALENLRNAFPGRYTERQLRRMVWRVYRHFALVISEIAHIPRKLHGTNYRDYVAINNVGPVIEAVFRGERVMMLTGHFGNWEMAGYMFGLWGFRSYAVIRPLDNPYLDRFLRRFREKTGQELIAKNGGSDKVREQLEKPGQIVCFLADQDARRHGVFVDYFGRPASTHKAIALLAMEYNSTVMVGGARRTKGEKGVGSLFPQQVMGSGLPQGTADRGGVRHSAEKKTPDPFFPGKEFHYEVFMRDVFHPEDWADADDPVHRLTQLHTSSLEQMVRSAPEQYLWLHRRWKTQPETLCGPHGKARSRTPAE
jgi:KDO2-lipid IV(A) lauroyltransferase